MTQPAIRVLFESLDHLREEYARTIRKGGVFAPRVAGLDERAACTLVLVHPVSEACLELSAEVVYVKADEPGKGVGVQLVGFGPQTIAAIERFIEQGASRPAHPAPRQASNPRDPGERPASAGQADAAQTDDLDDGHPQKLTVSSLHDRIRSLSLAEQVKLAREGGLQERVALERIFGKTVWEPILQNQRVTPPEVARIARMGTAPVPVLDLITGNAAWLAAGEVRRALLSNPRLSDDGLTKVLRSTPKHELQLIAMQTYYPPRVRKAARTLLNR